MIPGYRMELAGTQAESRLMKRELAIKALRKEHQGTPDLERRFREEARIHGPLQHPGIAPVHDVGRLADGHRHRRGNGSSGSS
jgi:serine/threonine protein kinase